MSTIQLKSVFAVYSIQVVFHSLENPLHHKEGGGVLALEHHPGLLLLLVERKLSHPKDLLVSCSSKH